MSIIFGTLRLDDRVVEANDLNRMQEALASFASDGSGFWMGGVVGLGHLMLYNTPESLQETLPLSSKSEDLVLTVAGRLDNRDVLSRALALDAPERDRIPDSQLILKAYQKWGIHCPQYLLGDWVFALWDGREQRLLIAADHFGGCGLYYYRGQGLFAFSSTIKGILAHPEVPHRLNSVWLAQIAPGFRRDSTTAYEGIYRLTPAHFMVVTVTEMTIQLYWHPSDIRPVRFKTDRDYLDAFQEIYAGAVRCRLRSHRPVGVTLSGGLDSGSVATLAARELAETGQHLTAVSAVPQYGNLDRTVSAGQFGDETPFIEAICHQAGNIDLIDVRAEQITPLAGIQRILEIFDQPIRNAANCYWIVGLFETAQQLNLGTLLTGQGGNFTVSYAGNRNAYLINLLVTGQWRRYQQEVQAWQTANQASWPKTLRNQMLNPFIESWTSFAQWRRQSRRTQSVIRLDKARSVMKNAQSAIPPADLNLMKGQSAHAMIRLIYHLGGYNAVWYEQGSAFGLEVRDPTSDIRVIEFCLGLPQDQYTRHGQQRLLIRRAMQGLMPNKVLWNERKGKQAADIVHRIRASQVEIQSTLNNLQTSSLAHEWLDLPYMNQVFEMSQQQLSPKITNEVFGMLQGVMLGLFLQRFEG